MHAPPARPAGLGSLKDPTLLTSALVWTSSHPEICKFTLRVIYDVVN